MHHCEREPALASCSSNRALWIECLRVRCAAHAQMVRLHELWQSSKSELEATRDELQRLQANASPSKRDATVDSLETLSVELRDKCRFTELQLQGAREECQRLAAAGEELRAELHETRSSLASLESVSQQQTPAILELQAVVQRLGREKQVRRAGRGGTGGGGRGAPPPAPPPALLS